MSENLARQFELLPLYFGWHVVICAIALGIGLTISLPLGVWSARRQKLGSAVLAVASVIQTIPSIALLALVYAVLVGVKQLLPEEVQFTALGFWPTIIALTLYSILPMLRNTVTGLRGLDPALIEAARGLGMTSRQRLMRVELPLAMPVIIAGVRTSTVWTVGIATLSTPIGQISLGNYIFGGLQRFDVVAVLFGCAASALLAIVLDLLIAGLEKAVTRRSKTGIIAAAVALLLVLASGIAGVNAEAFRHSEDSGRTVVIGAKNFNEQFILASLIEQRLNAAGINARRIESLGSLNVFNALAAGEIDVYVDYSGTIWTNVMNRQPGPPRQQVLAQVTDWLMKNRGIVCLGTLGFENTYALALRRDRAESLGLRSIADLTAHAPQLAIGGSVEFFERPEWIKLTQTYDLHFVRQVSMNPTLMYPAVADGEVDVISAFSSDGRIAAFDLVTLSDPRGAFPPYDAIVLLSRRAAKDQQLLDALRPLLGSIDVELMRKANQRVDVDGRTPQNAARWLDEQIQSQ